MDPDPPSAGDESVAYLFFHRPRDEVPREEYDSVLAAFHSSLRTPLLPGLRSSAAFRLPRAPWGERPPRPIYLDWYVLDGFGSLDPIRNVAYDTRWAAAHQDIARRAADGWGALYSTRGSPSLAPLPTLAFYRSPRARLQETLVGWMRTAPPFGTLWRRQLALGPAPEFCWVHDSGAEAPGGRAVLRLPAERIDRSS